MLISSVVPQVLDFTRACQEGRGTEGVPNGTFPRPGFKLNAQDPDPNRIPSSLPLHETALQKRLALYNQRRNHVTRLDVIRLAGIYIMGVSVPIDGNKVCVKMGGDHLLSVRRSGS
jgi:hypothetical protein